MNQKKLKSIFLSINKYLGLALPIWMESRKSLVFYFLLDLIVFILMFDKDTKISLDISNLRISCLYFIWGLNSYIFGRYNRNYKYNRLFLNLYYLLINTAITVLITYLIDKVSIIFLKETIPIGRNLFFNIGLISLIIQSLRSVTMHYSKFIDKSIFIVGEKDDIRNFKFKIKNFKIFKNIVEIDEKHLSETVKNNQTKFLTFIIVSQNNLINNYEFIMNTSASRNIEILSASEWFEKYLQKIPPDYLNYNPLEFNILSSNTINTRIKRIGDIVVSIIILIITLPLVIIAAILIKLEDNGPIFYNQIRTGLFDQELKIIKLRSMKENSELLGPVWSKPKDRRITKIGYLLRKTRIDEIPQLWNVLLGDMSLIGPRPERPEIEKELNKEIPNYKCRHTIKPGLSGWAQVNFPYGASIEDSSEKLSYDLFYIKNKSLWLDFLILLKTIKIIVTMDGSLPR